MRSRAARLSAVLLAGAAACAPDPDAPPSEQMANDGERARLESVIDAALLRVATVTDSIDDLLTPVPLLTPQQESAMRRFGNDAHLQRARALGVVPADSAEIDALLAAGRLVELEDSTDLWVVRELTHSAPYVTPDTRALLQRVGTAFQQELTAMGLPRYRLEVTSVLRTPEEQARLRQINSNAAAGSSAHEFATTVDVAYSSYAAPADPNLGIDAVGAEWLQSRLDRIGSAMLETAAARKSRELQAILGEVLIELQTAGDVLVTLERQQPVYHFTVAREQQQGG